MLTCYRAQYRGAPYAVLSRVGCDPPEMRPADDPQEGALGTWIRVPLRASYVDIDLHTTVIGDLANILYKAPHVWIFLGFGDGQVAGPYQLIYPVAKDGLFIKYFIDSQSDADLLFSGNTSRLRRIAGIQIVTSPGSRAYARHFGVQFVYAAPSQRHLLGNAATPAKQ